MRTLYLCGAGNPEGVRLAQAINREQLRWGRLVLLDDDPRKAGAEHMGVPVIGPLSLLDDADPETDEAVNLVARTTAGRRAVGARILASGIPYARMIASDVDLGGTTVAPDAIVYQHATIGPEAIVEEGAVVFMGAVVGHESHVGAGCVIASNAVLNARVVLGPGVYVGSCATIVPEVTVGAGATIGAGSLVLQDVAAGATAVGVPAELVKFEVARQPLADEACAADRPALDQRAIEVILLELWREVLGIDDVERDQNFFELGGRSLQALRVREGLRQKTGRELPITDMFRFPSVRTLAEHLARRTEASPLARAWARRAEARRSIHGSFNN